MISKLFFSILFLCPFTPCFCQNFLGYNAIDLYKYHQKLDYIYFESDTNQHGVPFVRTENRRTRETTLFFFDVTLQCHEYSILRGLYNYDKLLADLNSRFEKSDEVWYDHKNNTKYQVILHKTCYQLKITKIKD